MIIEPLQWVIAADGGSMIEVPFMVKLGCSALSTIAGNLLIV